jgi:hypothetical protein
LLPGSRAINAGDNAGAPPWDQRGTGFSRIVGGRIDIGAFEVQGRSGGPAAGAEGDFVTALLLVNGETSRKWGNNLATPGE